jgi:para-aminobenzoate synthetase component 1
VQATASVGGWWGRDLLEVTDDLGRLDESGRWAVAVPYEGEPVLARFAAWSRDEPVPAGAWRGPEPGSWTSSMDAETYQGAVSAVRDLIEAGDVYQANVCRVLSADLPDTAAASVSGLHALLRIGNPAPYAGYLELPEHGVHVVSASPELFLRVAGREIVSGPIKGTGRTRADLQDKDVAENIMIVDLVRNDLSIVSEPGSVTVPDLLAVEEHPGLVHLVSRVQARLRADVGWTDIMRATFPPGSVTGAPKRAARTIIAALEAAPRSYYCGAFGWVDADTGSAELAVAIRTFWRSGDRLHFGTGAGITWGSDPLREWQETELKAARLVGVAAGQHPPGIWQGDSP